MNYKNETNDRVYAVWTPVSDIIREETVKIPVIT